MTYYWIWPIICRLTWHFDHIFLCWLLQVFKWNSQHNKINLVFCFSRFIYTSYLVPIITYWSVSTSLFKMTTLQQSWTPYSIWINQYLWIEKYGIIYPSFPFIYKQQVLPEGKCGHRNVLSKRQVWMSIFHIINFKKKKIHGHRGPGFF